MATDHSSYVVGESLWVTISAHNAADAPVTLGFPSSLQSSYVMDGVYVNNEVGLAVLTEAVVPARGSREWTYRHRWDDYPLVPGLHSVVGRVAGYGESVPLEFAVVAPQPIVDDVFIDFETFPDGTRLDSLWATAFLPWGVTLRSDGGNLGLQRVSSGGNVVSAVSGAHPFNIAAAFSMLVHEVSVDVGAAAGTRVTMQAFDAAGALLGQTTSPEIASYPDLVGPLTFVSAVPIASVKWTSSNPFSGVSIDNLSLRVGAVPEPGSLLIAILGAVCGQLRLSRR
ncbi:MAG: hypothetical protein KF688_12770 [Pirellulales bacterium]|nr:hypothetical protein [Pirellulales bacterium]